MDNKILLIVGLGAFLLLSKSAKATTAPPIYRYSTPAAQTTANQLQQATSLVRDIRQAFGGSVPSLGNFNTGNSLMDQTIAANVPWYSDAQIAAQDQAVLDEIMNGNNDTYIYNPPAPGAYGDAQY